MLKGTCFTTELYVAHRVSLLLAAVFTESWYYENHSFETAQPALK